MAQKSKAYVAKDASLAAVVLAGGTGERFGNPDGKQLLDLCGKPVMTWSIEAFDFVSDVGLIVVVCPSERAQDYQKIALDPYTFATPIVVAPAGQIRQESAMNGIDIVPETFTYIAIHDAARPLVTPSLIRHAINMLKGSADADGVVVGHQSIDTLKVVNGQAIIGTPERSMFWVAQTPQIFLADVCRRAYRSAMFDGFVGTDDSSLVERIGAKVIMCNGPRDNIKVTVPEDLDPVFAAMNSRLAHRELSCSE